MNPKLHLTARRQLVYDALSGTTDHPTAADLMERLRADGHKLAYATVYNALRYLTEAGAIRELQLGPGAIRYDARLDQHQHVVCERCGRVDEVLDLETTSYLASVKRVTGYRVSHLDMIARGLCPACAEYASEDEIDGI